MAGPLRSSARDAGVTDAVKFVGWVDAETMPGHAAAADIGLVPHQSNPHTNTTVPHKLFHYMAAGIPVVGTATASVERILSRTGGGVVVPPESPGDMADAAVRLHESDEATLIGEAARRAVRTEYNWTRDGEQLRAVYEALAPPQSTSEVVRP